MCPARNTESEELYVEKCLLAGKIVANEFDDEERCVVTDWHTEVSW